jgi:hypothetical protein
MPEFMPIGDLRVSINQAIDSIAAAVADQRDRGLLVDMPESIDFQAILIFDWQALEMRVESTGVSAETTGGTEASRRSEESTQESTRQQFGEVAHDSRNTTEFAYKG